MKSTIIISAMLFLLSGEAAMARVYVADFTPSKVTVADGYLQLKLPTAMAVEGCSTTDIIALPDTHKYFDRHLSLAMTAFPAGKSLNVAIGAPCLGPVGWPQISVMALK